MPNTPNFLLITSDQQHWNTLGFLNPEIKTPALDKLAREGTVFSRAYCANPTCTPSRASMITGKYPSQHGAWSLGTKLPESETTVGGLLSKAGYRTALIGKAHFQPLMGSDEFPSLESYPIMQDLAFWAEFHGPFYGFDHVELARNHTDEPHVGQHYALWMEKKGLSNWRQHFREPTGTSRPQRHGWSIPEEYHYDTWIAERSGALLEQYAESGDSFFLWSSFFDPHPSYLVPRPWDTMYDPAALTVPSVTEGEHEKNPPHHRVTQLPWGEADLSPWRESGQWTHGVHSHRHDHQDLKKDVAVYYGMVSLMDKYIGAIIDKLDELGLSENTVVIFTTDHGHFYGQHGLIAKGPFHYEDMIKIPFIVRWPGKVSAGKTSEALQSLVDLPQSWLALAAIDAPRTMTGVDQSDVWVGAKDSARDWVLVENRHEPTTIHVKTYVEDRYKLTVYYDQPYGELFDLRTDPGEVNNLWDNPRRAQLKHELVAKLLFVEMGKEPLWMPRIAGA